MTGRSEDEEFLDIFLVEVVEVCRGRVPVAQPHMEAEPGLCS